MTHILYKVTTVWDDDVEAEHYHSSPVAAGDEVSERIRWPRVKSVLCEKMEKEEKVSSEEGKIR